MTNTQLLSGGSWGGWDVAVREGCAWVYVASYASLDAARRAYPHARLVPHGKTMADLYGGWPYDAYSRRVVGRDLV